MQAPKRWGIELRGNRLHWFTPREATAVAVAEIASVALVDDWEIPRLSIKLRNRMRHRVHPNCLGNLDQLSVALQQLNPYISFT